MHTNVHKHYETTDFNPEQSPAVNHHSCASHNPPLGGGTEAPVNLHRIAQIRSTAGRFGFFFLAAFVS